MAVETRVWSERGIVGFVKRRIGVLTDLRFEGGLAGMGEVEREVKFKGFTGGDGRVVPEKGFKENRTGLGFQEAQEENGGQVHGTLLVEAGAHLFGEHVEMLEDVEDEIARQLEAQELLAQIARQQIEDRCGWNWLRRGGRGSVGGSEGLRRG